jgi:hypothetical protein
MNNEDGFVSMEASSDHGLPMLCVMMNPGHHFRDIQRTVRRQQEWANVECNLP